MPLAMGFFYFRQGPPLRWNKWSLLHLKKVSIAQHFAILRMKYCPDCKEKKDESEFHPHKVARDGLRVHCKTCHNLRTKSYRQQNAQQLNERQKQLHLAHPERRTAFYERLKASPERLGQRRKTRREYRRKLRAEAK
jgi:hypothetical protein